MGGHLDAVPEVDHGNGRSERTDFGVAEMIAQAGADGTEVALPIEVGEEFGPLQCSALFLGEIGHVLPDRESIKALIGFRICTYLPRMHLHAVRAPVQLRGPKLDEMVDPAIQTMRIDGRMYLFQRGKYFWNGDVVTEGLSAHDDLLILAVGS